MAKKNKIKTKSSSKKRFKITGTGKIKRQHSLHNHLLTKKSKRRKKRLVKDTLVDKADMPNIRKTLNV